MINRINATANILTYVLVKENEIEVDRLHIQIWKMMIRPPVFGNALECETGSLFVCILPIKTFKFAIIAHSIPSWSLPFLFENFSLDNCMLLRQPSNHRNEWNIMHQGKRKNYIFLCAAAREKPEELRKLLKRNYYARYLGWSQRSEIQSNGQVTFTFIWHGFQCF